jgi:hypothetical protein
MEGFKEVITLHVALMEANGSITMIPMLKKLRHPK